ncbi:MAG: hypothetical protein IJ038_04765 [Clostridia bacterium]|nr:hypothetical protein [Clostridia bacterium]
MNKEQNIDDILKLLKSSYEDGTAEKAPDDKNSTDDGGALSHEELRQKLKDRFLSGDINEDKKSDYEADSFSYTLDDDFLSESAAESETADPDDEISLEQEADDEIMSEREDGADSEAEQIDDDDDGIPPFDMEDEVIQNDADESLGDSELEDNDGGLTFSELEGGEELEGELLFKREDIEEDSEDDSEDGIFIENEDGEIVLLHAEAHGGTEENCADEEDLEDIFDEEEADVDELAAEVCEELTEEDLPITEKTDGADAFEEAEEDEAEFFSGDDGQLALFENLSSADGEYAYDDESLPDTEDEEQIVMDFGDTDNPHDGDDGIGEIDEIDDAMLGIMLEVGDINAARSHVAAERVEQYVNASRLDEREEIDPSEAFAFEGEEFESDEQTDALLESYKRERKFTLLRLIGCAFFTFLLFIYELFPVLDIVTETLPSYSRYPTAYILIGMQMLVLSAALAWRELWGGFKKVFSLKADGWSAVSFAVLFVLVYDLALIIISPETVSYTFGMLASVYILFALVTEYLEVCREMKCFAVYSSDKKKFTFNTEGGVGSSAEKMYRGGLPYDKNVFEPCEIEFPNGYFSAINSSSGAGFSISYMITPIVLLSTAALIVSAMLGSTADAALSIFIITLTALCPLASLASRSFPLYKTSSRLYSREIAVASESMVHKYADCDYIVFNDMHLFKKALPQDNGIVILDEKNTKTVVEYLDALYGVIGGPMKDVFGGVSASKHTVRIRRIARNGVEALVDSAHSIILGDESFMRRYGIAFPKGETESDDGILGFVIDGRPSARLCLRYKSEPLFEMLVSRMAENGIKCAIETYDPVINSAFTARCRKNRHVPINVIHKNVMDLYSEKNGAPAEMTGMVVSSSRFKLIEGVVWCKRLNKISRIMNIAQWVVFGLVCGLLTLSFVLGFSGYLNQYFVLLVQMLSMLPVFAAMGLCLPPRDYFTVEAMQSSLDSDKKEKTKETEKSE